MTHPRGDVRVNINGEEQRLRLTLGALADIEGHLGGDLAALEARLKNPRVADIIFILHALLAGGGGALTLEALKTSDIDLAQATDAIAQAFESLGGEDTPGKSVWGEGASSGG